VTVAVVTALVIAVALMASLLPAVERCGWIGDRASSRMTCANAGGVQTAPQRHERASR
jgi:hypothetical protein